MAATTLENRLENVTLEEEILQNQDEKNEEITQKGEAGAAKKKKKKKKKKKGRL